MQEENWYDVIVGDCVKGMQTLEAGSVHTCVTSPPYFGLRDYQVEGQIGLEDTPDAYVARLVDVFREVRRVLRDDGTLWLNLGDSYAANRSYQVPSTKGGPKHGPGQSAGGAGSTVPDGLKQKDLIGIPWRVAFALQADGWYLRQDIIWHKPNPMPESVKDRCTKAHEYIFLLSKGPKYYFDSEAMKEPAENAGKRVSLGTKSFSKGQAAGAGVAASGNGLQDFYDVPETRNRRSVWTVTTKPFKGAHFATFPPDLIEPCVLAGSPAQCCAVCGAAGFSEMVDSGIENPTLKGSTFTGGKTGARDGGDRTQEGARTLKVPGPPMPTCACGGGVAPGLVLDPFGGSGTTAGVALKHGRNAILCELNPDYDALIDQRVDSIRFGKK
jgi:DNA modification methylase